MGITPNEKYKGDILLGKTFTVDPISKGGWRIWGEAEDGNTYTIIMNRLSLEEMFEPERRKSGAAETGNRKHGVTPGKKEKIQSAVCFSCLLECGFCGANLSRRRWHSNSKYKKTIWQCVKATKEGKVASARTVRESGAGNRGSLRGVISDALQRQ